MDERKNCNTIIKEKNDEKNLYDKRFACKAICSHICNNN